VVVGSAGAKAALDLAVRPSGEQRHLANDNDPEGIAEAVGGLQTIHQPRVLVAELGVADLPVAVVNPRPGRDAGPRDRASGEDRSAGRAGAGPLRPGSAAHPSPLHARCLTKPPRRWQRWSSGDERLGALRTAEENRLGATQVALVRARIQVHLAWLEAGLEAELAEGDEELHRRARAGRSSALCPGHRPERAAAAAGGAGRAGAPVRLADRRAGWAGPLTRASGTLRGRRAIWGGRRAVRTALSMGTLRATRCHPALRLFYERLLAAGKAKKGALVACMRKLLIILNAMCKHQTPWQAQAA